MFSSAASVARIILPYITVSAEAETAPTRAATVLSTIDQCLALGAGVFVCAVLICVAVRPSGNFLTQAPLRPNRMREDAIAMAVLVWIMAAAALSGLARMADTDPEGIITSMFVGNGAHIAGTAACLVLAATRFTGGIRAFCLGPEASPNSRRLGWTVLLFLAAVGLCPLVRDGTASTILYFWPDYAFPAHPTIEALQGEESSQIMVVALWLGAAVIAPLAEELFFRGIVQTCFVNLLKNRWLAILLASVAFGAVHFGQPHAVPALAVLGLLIGFAYERTGSMLPPVLIHSLFNLKTLLWENLGASPT